MSPEATSFAKTFDVSEAHPSMNQLEKITTSGNNIFILQKLPKDNFVTFKVKKYMNKRVIGIVLGVIVGGAFIFFGQTLGHYLFPAKSPLPVNPKDWEVYIETEVPFLSKFIVLVSYALSAFVASIISTFITGRTSMKPMLSAVAILHGFAVLNFLYLPHPSWMWIGMFVSFFPFGFIAYYLIRKKESHDS
jgi:hypothetical protein